MIRLATVLAFLAATAAAQENPLAPFLRPLEPRFRLEPMPRIVFDRLRPAERLAARGFDPERYVAPPAFQDALVQAHNVRHRLRPGFRYRGRLAAKQREARRVLRRVPPAVLVAGLRDLERWTPEDFARRFAGAVPREARWIPTQAVQALRRSERAFQDWLVGEVARRIDALSPARRAPALDALVRGLAHGHAEYRLTCAEVLGDVRDPLAASALARRVGREKDPVVRAALVRARTRHAGPRLDALLRKWARPRPRGRTFSFYGIETASRRVVFCLDASRSMLFPMDGMGGKREPRIDKTRRELFRTLESLPDDVHFTIYLFGARVVPWRRHLVPATPANREAALEFVDERRILNGTNLYEPVRAALDSDADTVFLLTDGEPNNGTVVDPALIVEALADRNRYRDKVVHAIGLSQDQNAELLVNLAARCGGRYEASR